MMKSYFFSAFIIFMVFSFLFAEDAPKQKLKHGDVKHFIKTFPQLKADLKIQYDTNQGDMTVDDAIKLNKQSFEILKKHGWDENFYEKSAVILLGYSFVVYGVEKKKAETGLEKSLKDIDANPNLSDEMKNQLKEQMKMVKGVLSTQQSDFKKQIHPKDLELVRPHIEELKKILDE